MAAHRTVPDRSGVANRMAAEAAEVPRVDKETRILDFVATATAEQARAPSTIVAQEPVEAAGSVAGGGGGNPTGGTTPPLPFAVRVWSMRLICSGVRDATSAARAEVSMLVVGG